MKWTQAYVWDKVNMIVPHARPAGDHLPEALKAAAVTLFLNGESLETGSFRAHVVKVCLGELGSVGFLTFGDIEEDWE